MWLREAFLVNAVKFSGEERVKGNTLLHVPANICLRAYHEAGIELGEEDRKVLLREVTVGFPLAPSIVYESPENLTNYLLFIKPFLSAKILRPGER